MEENRVGILAQGKAPAVITRPDPKDFRNPGRVWARKTCHTSKPKIKPLARIRPTAVAAMAPKARQRRPASSATGTKRGQVWLISQEAQEKPSGQRRAVKQQQAAAQEHGGKKAILTVTEVGDGSGKHDRRRHRQQNAGQSA